MGGGTASINFQGGTLTFPDTPANQDSFNTAIGAGIVNAYEGYGQVVMDPNETPGVITVRGVHPLNPSPRDGAVVGPGTVELSWMLPDPVVPGQPVLVNVYFTDDYDALWNFTDPAAIRVVSMQNVSSVVVQAQPKTRYYWAVDTYIGSGSDPVLGPIFTFTADNKPPVVVAAEDVVAWLTDGVAVVNLAGSSVTDDGAISPYTVLWTVVSEPDDPNSPDAVIANPRTKDTSITLSAVGEYVLQLEAFDGEYTGSDTVTINVFSDSCEAAKSLPDYELLPGDLNGDCVVNDLDLVILQDHWLECNALDCTDQGL